MCDLKADGTEEEEKNGISLLCNTGVDGERAGSRLISVAYNKISVDERGRCSLMERCQSAGTNAKPFVLPVVLG